MQAQKDALNGWTEILQNALAMVEDPAHKLGAVHFFDQLTFTCFALLSNPGYHEFLQAMLPRIYALASDPNPVLRKCAVRCLTSLVWENTSQAVLDTFDAYTNALMTIANEDQAVEPRIAVVEAFRNLVFLSYEYVAPGLEGIFDFMLQCSASPDSRLSLEALDFWAPFLVRKGLDQKAIKQRVEALRPHLASVLPVLVNKLAYSPEELALLHEGADVADADIADADKDVRPGMHKGTTGAGGDRGLSNSHAGEEGKGDTNRDGLDGDLARDDDDDDDYDMDDDDLDFSPRRCAAQTLDRIAGIYRGDVLPIMVPLIETLLQSEDWQKQEMGVLALGVIARGCGTTLQPSLPDILPSMVPFFTSQWPLLRSIACWSLPAYSPHFLQDKALLEPVLQGVLQCMLDRSKKVQRNACAGLATLQEAAKEATLPYMESILGTVAQAITQYQRGTRACALDCLDTVARSVPAHIGLPQYTALFMPAVLQLWAAADTADTTLLDLLDMSGSLAKSMGAPFLDFAGETYARAKGMLETTVASLEELRFADSPDCHALRDVCIGVLDFIASMAMAVGDSIAEAIASDETILPIITRLLADSNTALLASCLSLTGELFTHAFSVLGDFAPAFMAAALTHIHLDASNDDQVANGVWSITRLLPHIGADGIRPFLPELLPKLRMVLEAPEGIEIDNSRLNTAILFATLCYIAIDDALPFVTESLLSAMW